MILILALGVGTINHSFWSVSTVFDIFRNSFVNLIFALGVLVVLASGGIDVSFAAIGIFAGYATAVIFLRSRIEVSVVVPFIVAAAMGLILGLANGAVIATFRLPTLIVTLGTQGIIRGALLLYIGAKALGQLPDALETLNRIDLLRLQLPNGDLARLNIMLIPVVILCVLTELLLRYTVLGRGIYAVGGDVESARRAGFPVARIHLFVYTFVGVLAGMAGMAHVALSRQANPYDLVGGELNVIAAVVLGGASLFGGKGSVLGTVLGVILISLIHNCLILLGVPSFWERATIGLLLLIGAAAQALGNLRQPTMNTVATGAVR